MLASGTPTTSVLEYLSCFTHEPAGAPTCGLRPAATGGANERHRDRRLVLGIIGAAIALIPIIGVFFAWLPASLAITFGSIGIYNASRWGGMRRATAWWALALGLSPVPIWFAGAVVLALFGAAVPGSDA